MPLPLCRLLLLVLLSLAPTVALGADPWKIERFELPTSRSGNFQDLILDESGSPWVLANGNVYHFDGQAFHELDHRKFSSGQYLIGLYGGPKQGAYLSQLGDEERQGKLYRLVDGHCRYVTTYYYDHANRRPGLYVANDGRLFNWGEHFLAVYADGDWRRIEGQFSDQPGWHKPTICDLGEDVYFYSSLNNRIYRCDADNQLTVADGPQAIDDAVAARQQPMSRPEIPVHVIAAPWNGDRVLVLLQRPTLLLAFDVRTRQLIEVSPPVAAAHQAEAKPAAKPQPASEPNAAPPLELKAIPVLPPQPQYSFSDALAMPGGSVWLIPWGNSPLFALSTDGKWSEPPATETLRWQEPYRTQLREPVVDRSGDALVLGANGLAIYRDQQLTRLNWKNGLFAGSVGIRPGPHGELWLPESHSGAAVLRLTIGSGDPPVEEVAEDWTAFKLVRGGQVWRLGNDAIALFDVNHPQQLTRIVGDQVTYQPMPFQTPGIVHSLVDDQGHLLIQIPSGRTYDIREDGVDEFSNLNAAFDAALKRGATRFDGWPDFAGVVMTDDKRLWYAGKHSPTVTTRSDGDWSAFRLREGIDSLIRTPDDQILIRAGSNNLYGYDAGQVQNLGKLDRYAGVMFGPHGVQPYDKQLAVDQPNLYYPAIFDRVRSNWRLYLDPAGFEAARDDFKSELAMRTSVEVSKYLGNTAAAAGEGSWLFRDMGGGPLTRVFRGEARQVDFTRTPLMYYSLTDVIEAADGDVWYVSLTGSSWSAFRLTQSQLSLQLADVPQTCGRELELKIDIEPARVTSTVELFADVDGQPLPLVPTADGKYRLRFTASGEHQCVIRGMRYGSIFPSKLEFAVTATVASPETVWESEEKTATIATLRWRPPVRAVATAVDRPTNVAWRIAGQPWRMLDEAGALTLVDQPAGDYDLEFRAVEDDFWYDETPLTVKVTYAPDLNLIVHQLADLIKAADSQQTAEVPSAQLRKLGLSALPQLDREIEADRRTAPWWSNLKVIRERIEQAEKNRQRQAPQKP